MSDIFLAFYIGSTFPATFISQIYLAMALQKGGSAPISYELMNIGVHIAYGLANMLLVYMGNTVQNAAIIGGLLGLCLSMVGRFGYNLPVTMFGFSPQTSWQVHVIAPVLYAIIFVVLVRNLNLLLIRH